MHLGTRFSPSAVLPGLFCKRLAAPRVVPLVAGEPGNVPDRCREVGYLPVLSGTIYEGRRIWMSHHYCGARVRSRYRWACCRNALLLVGQDMAGLCVWLACFILRCLEYRTCLTFDTINARCGITQLWCWVCDASYLDALWLRSCGSACCFGQEHVVRSRPHAFGPPPWLSCMLWYTCNVFLIECDACRVTQRLDRFRVQSLRSPIIRSRVSVGVSRSCFAFHTDGIISIYVHDKYSRDGYIPKVDLYISSCLIVAS